MSSKVLKSKKAQTKKPAQKAVASPARPAAGDRPKPPAAGMGRVKGVPNKATSMARKAIAKLADGMTGEVQGWLRWVALGVGHAWQVWDKPSDWTPEVGMPENYKLVGPAKNPTVLIPFQGLKRTITLQDVADGLLPAGTIIEWIVAPDPDSAANTMLRALEYHIPKLGRVEHTDPDGKPVVPAQIVISGVSAPKR